MNISTIYSPESKHSTGTVAPLTGKTKNLRDLFVMELTDIYWAECAILKVMPLMIKKAKSVELVEALYNVMDKANVHIKRLEEIFVIINEEPIAKKCKAIEGIIIGVREIMEDTEKGSVRDAGIICAAQKVGHYEIATYGTLHRFALTLSSERAALLLEVTLNEEKYADAKLSGIAESYINEEAI